MTSNSMDVRLSFVMDFDISNSRLLKIYEAEISFSKLQFGNITQHLRICFNY